MQRNATCAENRNRWQPQGVWGSLRRARREHTKRRPEERGANQHQRALPSHTASQPASQPASGCAAPSSHSFWLAGNAKGAVVNSPFPAVFRPARRRSGTPQTWPLSGVGREEEEEEEEGKRIHGKRIHSAH
jgi:hypothetical protein